VGIFIRANPLLLTHQNSQNVINSKVNQTVTEDKVNYISTRTILTLYGRVVYVSYRVFNLKVDRPLSREYFTSDAIYKGSAGMTLYYYMCRSWQDCCRKGENRSWPSVSVESVESECWCLNNAFFTLSYCG
jgi:hypothetical protein